MEQFKHFPVMAKEAVGILECQNGKIYVDATLGGGGYSSLIAEKISPDGLLYSFDIDDDAISAAKEHLNKYKNVKIIKNSHVNIAECLKKEGIEKITGGVVYDFGASYFQLTSATRGFSFSKEAPLDMRFNKDADFTAYDVVNNYSEENLVKIFSEYGEERFSKRIAKAIVLKRKQKKIETTTELSDLIIEATPRIKSKLHPATRVFQAIRIEVNQELENIKNTLINILPFLETGAIISAVTFHSAEDRIVKNFFRDNSQKFNDSRLEILTKKPLYAAEEEVKLNPPSRSAKLRAARVIK
ncbi:MAG: 16S rRNA (cytosine(1402)-N(4))-methyltransferase RsmH [Candidatus Gastranaerophilales bacterium]|nr:16S rRNA (cytosine(1402)-N(4))-methyltransferase RsmH [Candidatus Gastranaerophilales bacterium]